MALSLIAPDIVFELLESVHLLQDRHLLVTPIDLSWFVLIEVVRQENRTSLPRPFDATPS
jgi:hypothetical protein